MENLKEILNSCKCPQCGDSLLEYEQVGVFGELIGYFPYCDQCDKIYYEEDFKER